MTWSSNPSAWSTQGFFVPASKLDRLTTFYRPTERPRHYRSSINPGMVVHTAQAARRAGALVSTVDDLWAFATMLAGGRGTSSPRLGGEMTRDRMTAEDAPPTRGSSVTHSGWGLMMSVPAGPTARPACPVATAGRRIGHHVAHRSGRRITAIVLTPTHGDVSPTDRNWSPDFWAAPTEPLTAERQHGSPERPEGSRKP